MLELRDQGKTCQLKGLEFEKEDFRGAVLVGVNFRDSEFLYVDFSGANLFDADMTNTHHIFSQFNNLGDKKTVLERTDFTNASFSYCKFRDANMKGAIFRGAYFSDVAMNRTDVTNIDFTNVDFSDIDEMDFDSFIGLDQIICDENSTRGCRVFQDCSRPDNPYC